MKLSLSQRQVESLGVRAKGSAGVFAVNTPKPQTFLLDKPATASGQESRANSHYLIRYQRIVHLPALPSAPSGERVPANGTPLRAPLPAR